MTWISLCIDTATEEIRRPAKAFLDEPCMQAPSSILPCGLHEIHKSKPCLSSTNLTPRHRVLCCTVTPLLVGLEIFSYHGAASLRKYQRDVIDCIAGRLRSAGERHRRLRLKEGFALRFYRLASATTMVTGRNVGTPQVHDEHN